MRRGGCDGVTGRRGGLIVLTNKALLANSLKVTSSGVFGPTKTLCYSVTETSAPLWGCWRAG